MGANAQTSVPAFTSGQVLTASQVTQINTGIPVFASSTERDAAFGGAGEKTLAEGQMAYLEDTNETQVYDGSAWAAVGGGGGLSLITSSIFSGVSTVSIDDVFTADYQTYKIVFTAEHSVGTGNMWLRYRSGGADTTSGYGYGEAIIRHSDGYFASDGNGTSQQQIALGYVGSRVWHEVTVWEPYETQYTGAWYIASHPSYQEWGGGFHNTQTSFDGFKIYPTGGTFTGNVYVYGMAKT